MGSPHKVCMNILTLIRVLLVYLGNAQGKYKDLTRFEYVIDMAGLCCAHETEPERKKTMSSTATKTLEITAAPARSESGITLLEAYSVLAGRDARHNPALAIPFPGQPSGVDPEERFWTLKIRNVG